MEATMQNRYASLNPHVRHRIIELHQTGMTDADIARTVGRSLRIVRVHLKGWLLNEQAREREIARKRGEEQARTIRHTKPAFRPKAPKPDRADIGVRVGRQVPRGTPGTWLCVKCRGNAQPAAIRRQGANIHQRCRCRQCGEYVSLIYFMKSRS